MPLPSLVNAIGRKLKKDKKKVYVERAHRKRATNKEEASEAKKGIRGTDGAAVE